MDKIRDTQTPDNYKIILNCKQASHALPGQLYYVVPTCVRNHHIYNFESVIAQAVTCLERIIVIGIYKIKKGHITKGNQASVALLLREQLLFSFGT